MAGVLAAYPSGRRVLSRLGAAAPVPERRALSLMAQPRWGLRPNRGLTALWRDLVALEIQPQAAFAHVPVPDAPPCRKDQSPALFQIPGRLIDFRAAPDA